MNWNKTKRKNHDAGTESRRRRRIKISTHTTNDQNQSSYLIQFVLFCAQNENKTKNSINIQDSIIIINSSWKQKFLFFTNNFFWIRCFCCFDLISNHTLCHNTIFSQKKMMISPFLFHLIIFSSKKNLIIDMNE